MTSVEAALPSWARTSRSFAAGAIEYTTNAAANANASTAVVASQCEWRMDRVR